MMDGQPEVERITFSDLKAMLAATGELYPERQIKRWRDDDLLPHPQRVNGQWVYPPHTLDQVRAILRWKQVERRHDQIRFWLWWEGFPITVAAVRQTLHALLQSRFAQVLNAPGADPLEQAEHLAQQMLARTTLHPLHRQIEHCLPDPENQRSFWVTLLRMLLGDLLPLEWEDYAEQEALPVADLLDKGMGLWKARTVRFNGHDPWVPETALQTFAHFQEQHWIDLRAILAEIDHLTATELDQARQVAQEVIVPLIEVVRGMLAMLGKDALGLGSVRFFDEEDPTLLGLLVIFLVRLLRTDISNNLAALQQTGQTYLSLTRISQQFFPDLRRELPQISKRIDYYHHQFAEGVITQKELTTKMEQLRRAFPEDLDAFFLRHPEYVVESPQRNGE